MDKKLTTKLILFLLILNLLAPSVTIWGTDEENPGYLVIKDKAFLLPNEERVEDAEKREVWSFEGFDWDWTELDVEEENKEIFKNYLQKINYTVEIPSSYEGKQVDVVQWHEDPLWYTDQDYIDGKYVKLIKLPKDGNLQSFELYGTRSLIEKVEYEPQNIDFYFGLPNTMNLKGYKLEDKDYPVNPGKNLTIGVSRPNQADHDIYIEGFANKAENKFDYDISKIAYRRILTPHNDPVIDKLDPWLKPYVNLVRLNIHYRDSQGKELNPQNAVNHIVGKQVYSCSVTEDSDGSYELKYNEEPNDNPNYLDNYYVYKNELSDKQIKQCNDKAKEVMSDPENEEEDKITLLHQKVIRFTYGKMKIPGIDTEETYHKHSLCPKNYFYLDQKETETIQAPEIQGYKTPAAQEVSFAYNDTDFKMNEEDFVWEKDVVFTYEKEEDSTPQPGKFEVNYYVDNEIYTTTSATPAKPLTKPSDPVKEGHSFVGWFEKDGSKWDFSKAPTSNLNLYAKFAPVDKTKLEAKIKDLEALKAGDFTSATWVDLQVSLRLAKQALEKENVSQEQIDERLGDLQRAYLALKRSSSNPDEPTPPAPKKLSILEVKNPKDIKVNLGTSEDKAKEELDRYVEIIASDKKTYYAPLTWSIYNYDKDKSAVYTAKGSYRIPNGFEDANTQKITTAKVEVLGQSSGEFKYFENLYKIKIKKGERLTLPTRVVAHYKDGSKKSLSVTWETKNFDSNKAGTSWIYGKVEGLEAKPSICVEVINESQDLTNKKVSVLRDVRGHWAQDAIVWTVENNLFYGNAQQEFEPNKKITRGEFISVLFRLTGERSENYLNTHFDDVHQGEYFQGAIEWGRRNNVVAGYGDGKFHPDDTLTREQEAAILRRFNNTMNFKFEGVGRKTFADEGRISDWAKEDVRTLQVQGLMTGNQYNQFMPKKQITRAEIAQILYNMNKRVIGTRSTQFNTNATTTTGSSPTTSSGTRYQGILPTNNGTSTTVNPGTTPDRNQSSTTTQGTATVSIDILTGLRNLNAFSSNMRGRIPSNGYFLNPTKISITPGESVWDVTQRAANQYGISIRKEFTPKYNSIYVQAINGIGEFDGGQRSGWMYNINGIYPNRGASAIKVKDGDTIQWRYTMDYGNDIGGYLGDY